DHTPVDTVAGSHGHVVGVVAGGVDHRPVEVGVGDGLPHGGLSTDHRPNVPAIGVVGVDFGGGFRTFAPDAHPAATGPVATVHSAPIDHVSGDPAHTVSSGVTDALRSAEKAVENIFCHAAGTRIAMRDGTYKAVEQLEMGDEVLLGGTVIGRGVVLAEAL